MTYQSPNCVRSVRLRVSRGSASSASASASASVTIGSWSGAGAASGSPTRLSRPPLSTAGVTSATPVAVSWSVVSADPSDEPGSPAPVSRSTLPRTSMRASSRSMASTSLSVSKGSRGSVTGISSLSGACRRRGRSAEDGEHALREEDVEARDERHHERHEEDDHGRVGDQLAATRPDDLAQLGHDLAEEPAQAAPAADLLGPGALRGGPRPRAGALGRAAGGAARGGTLTR